MEFGIALAGGGARGAAHVGVLLALEEFGLYPRSIAGTSAGGIVAGLYAAGNSAQRLKEIVIEISKTGTYYFDANLAELAKAVPQFIINHKIDMTGLIKGNRLERFLFELTNGKSMAETNITTIIPAVDINSGYTIAYTNSLAHVKSMSQVRWKTNALISEAMRASSAVPAIFEPKWMDGMCLVDGGVADVLPVDLLLAAGEPNVLAVDISPNYKMPKKNIIDISAHSLSIMSTCLKEYHSRGEKFSLKPSLPDEAGLLTFEQMVECMNSGYETTKRNMPAIQAALR